LRFDCEMALTRADFLRLLPVAVGHAPFRVEGDAIVAEGLPPPWRIALAALPDRAFGPVGIPVLAVRLEVEAASPAAGQAFLSRFLLGFQRAGG